MKVENYSDLVDLSLICSTNIVGEQKVIFDHVPKCGGTSIYSVLSSYLKKDITNQIKSISYHKAISLLSDFRCVSGHIWFQPKINLVSDVFHITFLREPIDRIISDYYFQKYDLALQQAVSTQKIRKVSFSDYVFTDDPVSLNQISNYQTCHYLQIEWDGVSLLNEEQRLESAKRALSQYNLVGIYSFPLQIIELIKK